MSQIQLPDAPPAIDALATVRERFYGTGKTAENMFDRYTELVADASANGVSDNDAAEALALESILRQFLKGCILP